MANYTLKQFIAALKSTGLIGFDAGGKGSSSSPVWTKFQTTGGTDYYLFLDTNKRLRVHTSVPTANTDGVVVSEGFADTLTTTATSATYTTGTLRESGGKTYKYVQNIDLTAANGWALCAASASDPNIVSGDASGGSAITTIPIGVAIGAIPKDSYGWVLVRGYHSSVIADGSIAAGEGLIKHASTDGGVDTAAAGSTSTITVHQIFGKALEADTTSRVKALISTL